ncbi:MAG: phosphoglycerate kinase [Phenylobacterium sp.]|jgi:phosphoglycerate kinase|uniref:phosphoglycerate kinase n=1 Tax=Phenylobacterium sp. TaxID=1871053 RepID=UPI002A36EBAD|nr:phosphoglycerate kinase [Phenylobacterium sp.]MDX9998668.1 phosphoglycerate kinase [Phenylobacterium sp.]
MSFRTLDGTDLAGKRALVRVDFNVPMDGGRVTDDTRLRAALPTIDKLRKGGAKVVLLAHFDRPKGKRVPEMSLRPVVEPLSKLLGAPVAFADDCVGEAAQAAIGALKDGDVLLLENVRFHAGEEKNDPEFAAALAAGGDLYVNDAFSAAHRAHASTEGLAHRLPAYAGEQMRRELEALEMALGSPRRPVMGIVGGAKVSTKLDLLNNLVGKLQYLAIGGGMANTFRFAQGYGIGGSLCEKDMADTARQILEKAKAAGCEVILPTDAVVAADLAPGVATRTVELTQAGALGDEDKIFDVGPKTLAQILQAISHSATLVWNGPLGVFEVQPFDRATVEAAQHAAQLAKSGKLVAVAGGGDTVAALNAAGVSGDFTFVSTAGGAFLEWMEGKALPGVAALAQ